MNRNVVNEELVLEDESDALAFHRVMHAELTSDLLNMAQHLKSNTEAFGDLLEKDAQVCFIMFFRMGFAEYR